MDTQISQPFGALVRRHRLRAGLTQEQLAERAGLSARAVGDLEREAARRPRLDTVTRLAAALDLPDTARRALLHAARPEPSDAAPAIPPPSQDGVEPPPSELLAMTLTPLVGREHEEAAAMHLLGQSRLLTLTGPGGVGKTRLALHLAAQARARYTAVHIVSLATVREPALVLDAVARTLDLGEDTGELMPQVRAALDGPPTLLVLDNFERVLSARDSVLALLVSCPALTVLVTSRGPLRLRGEQEFDVPPLGLPPAGLPLSPEQVTRAPAVQLFVQRARAVRPDFALTPQTAPLVAEICRRLDGLPLAIELAAARVRLLGPAALLERLSRRLPLLTEGSSDLPDRQRTMGDAIAWSYELLGVAEQTLFRRLAVFVGGASLDAVAAMCTDEQGRTGSGNPEHEGHETGGDLTGERQGAGREPGIERLAAQGLLRVEEDAAGQPRVWLLETIREYGLDLLERSGEADSARRRHALYYLEVAERGAAAANGPAQGAWLARLEREHDNLRAALAWFLGAGAQDMALRLAGALGWFWWQHSHYTEGRAWLEEALARDTSGPDHQDDVTERAAALYWAGQLAYRQDDYAQALAHCEESLALARRAGDWPRQALALKELGSISGALFDWPTADSYTEQSLLLFRALGDQRGAAQVLNNLGNQRRLRGDYRQAAELLNESMALKRCLGDTWGYALTLGNLGLVTLDTGENARAGALLRESLDLFRDLGDKNGQADALLYLAFVAIAEGAYGRAMRLLGEGLMLCRQVRRWWSTLESVHTAAFVALMLTGDERVDVLLRTCRDLWRAYGNPWGEAMAVHFLARSARRAGKGRRAREVCLEGLSLHIRVRHTFCLVQTLEEYTLAALSDGLWAEAARYWGTAASWREAVGSPWWPCDRAAFTAAEQAGCRALGETAWGDACAAGRALTPAQAAEELLACKAEARTGRDEPVRGAAPSAGTFSPSSGTTSALARFEVAGSVSDGHPLAGEGTGDSRAGTLEWALDEAEALCAALAEAAGPAGDME